MTLSEYIDAHSEPEPPYLAELDRLAHLRLYNPRMCSGHRQGRLLAMLTSMVRPRLALELGTYAGYSALCIAEGLPEGGVLHTVEHNDELQDFIEHALTLTPHGRKVRLHIGDALELIPQIAPGSLFDMAFLDADKRQYPAYLEALLPRMAPGSFILADNTLWDGHVADAGERHSPMTRGVMAFNDAVSAHPRLTPLILPFRDGLTLIRVNP